LILIFEIKMIVRIIQIYVILIFTLLYSCSDKDNTYETISNKNGLIYLNKNIPANPDLNIKLNNLFEIAQYDSSIIIHDLNPKYFFGLTADSNDNIFISTYDNNNLIYKYDNAGEYINTFSRMGKGPGESSGYDKLIIIQDTLLAVTLRDYKINKFDLDGNYLNSTILDRFYYEINKLTENSFIAFAWDEEIIGDNKYEIHMEIVLLNNYFKRTKTISEKKVRHEGILDARSKYYPYICNNSREIFISWLSENDYEILVYDIITGDYKYTIKNSSRVKYYSEIELDWMSQINNVDMRKLFAKLKKKVINTIYCDNNENLWVLATKERNENKSNILIADIYTDGVFQNTVSFNEIEYHDFSGAFSIFKIVFVNNRLYYHNYDDYDDEKGKVIKVFEYLIK